VGIRVLDGGIWYGEGEVKVFRDGDGEHPTICGTGLEDYVGSAWGMGAHNALYAGSPLRVREPGDKPNPDFVGFYRWHLLDPIVFTSELRVTVQQIGYALFGADQVLPETSCGWCRLAASFESRRSGSRDLRARRRLLRHVLRLLPRATAGAPPSHTRRARRHRTAPLRGAAADGAALRLGVRARLELTQPLHRHHRDGNLEVVGADESGHGDTHRLIASLQELRGNSLLLRPDHEQNGAGQVEIPGGMRSDVLDPDHGEASPLRLIERRLPARPHDRHVPVGAHRGAHGLSPTDVIERRVDDDAVGARDLRGAHREPGIAGVGDVDEKPDGATRPEQTLDGSLGAVTHKRQDVGRGSDPTEAPQHGGTGRSYRNAERSRALDQLRDPGAGGSGSVQDQSDGLTAIERPSDLVRTRELPDGGATRHLSRSRRPARSRSRAEPFGPCPLRRPDPPGPDFVRRSRSRGRVRRRSERRGDARAEPRDLPA
jgi:hypothetical protein